MKVMKCWNETFLSISSISSPHPFHPAHPVLAMTSFIILKNDLSVTEPKHHQMCNSYVKGRREQGREGGREGKESHFWKRRRSSGTLLSLTLRPSLHPNYYGTCLYWSLMQLAVVGMMCGDLGSGDVTFLPLNGSFASILSGWWHVDMLRTDWASKMQESNFSIVAWCGYWL